MKTYLINLAAAPERLQRMTGTFAALEIPFVRFEAIDRKIARSHEAFAKMPRPKYREWSDGELGCLFSHYELWKRIAGGTENFGAIFEDDIHVSPLLKDLLAAGIPEQADLIKLETHSATAYRAAPEVRLAGVGLHRLFEMHYGSAGYIISRAAARSLVDKESCFDVPVDHLLFEPMHRATLGLKVLQCVPGLVVQDDALPRAKRVGGSLTSQMTGRVAAAPRRPMMERISRFPRSGARRIERLLNPMVAGVVEFADGGR